MKLNVPFIRPGCWLILTCLLAFPGRLPAALDWPLLDFTPVVTNTFSYPSSISHAGDGSRRLFVAESQGLVWAIQDGNVLSPPFLNITNRVLSTLQQLFPSGLLGLAFPPGFSTNGHVYASYVRTNGWVTLSRFQLSPNPNLADPDSEQILLATGANYSRHNGGQIAFGPDGCLYVATGDGGPEDDPRNRAQNPKSLLGKLLRLDVESGHFPYAIPPNNPFVGDTNYAPEIWALGLRNPQTFSFDRATGDIFIGDTGQEGIPAGYGEINFQPANSPGGLNFGWPIMQGTNSFYPPAGFTNWSALILPVAWYKLRDLTNSYNCWVSVSGGYVYRGPNEPRLNGTYLYGDYAEGWIWAMKQSEGSWRSITILHPAYSLTNLFFIRAFGEDEAGRLYLADCRGGKIYQLQDTHQAWAPAFAAPSGTIYSNSVVVTCPTPDAEIHYTANSAEPTLADPMVFPGQAIQVASGATNKIRAFRADLSPSVVVSAIYTNKVAAPVFTPPAGSVTNGTLVTLSTVTPGAAIYFTTNGTTPTTNSLLYAQPLAITSNILFKAMGVNAGYSNSAVATAVFSLAQVVTPSFTPPAGPITNGTCIAISCATPNSRIYFTVDGYTPTTNSPLYAGPLAIEGDTTLKAVGVSAGYLDSGVNTVFFARVKAAMPAFDPPQALLTKDQFITITCATPGATVYYTLDGSVPDTNSLLYAAPVLVRAPVTLQARSYRSDLNPSDVQSVFYGLLDLQRTVVTTLAGRPTAGFSNGPAGVALFSSPQSVCLDPAGTLFVADTGNHVIRAISPSGQVTTFAGTGTPGSQLGVVTNAQFSGPTGVAADVWGNVYVADPNNCNRVCKIDPFGMVSVLAYRYTNCYYAPSLWQLVADSSCNVYVGSWASVAKVTYYRTISYTAGPAWCCPEGWGTQTAPGLDAVGNVYAASSTYLWQVTPNGLTNLFAGGPAGFSDGPRLLSRFQGPQALAGDALTNLFVSDTTRIRLIRPDGWVSTVAGTGVSGYQNGLGTLAQFGKATGLCVDRNGNIYVADSANHCIRKISPDSAAVGLPDDWQIAHFGYIGIDPNADPDHDGLSNYAEFWAGTDPKDFQSRLAIDSASLLSGGQMQLSWQTVAGKTYTVQYSTNLVSWFDWGTPVSGDGGTASLTDPDPTPAGGQKYYRIALKNL